MTNKIVPSITDEHLAEIAGYAEQGGLENEEAAQLDIGELRALITRLRAAEADARRYRWLRDYAHKIIADGPCIAMVGSDGAVMRREHGVEMLICKNEADQAIDAAMGRKP